MPPWTFGALHKVLTHQLIGYFLGCTKTSELLAMDLTSLPDEQIERVTVLRNAADEVAYSLGNDAARAFFLAGNSFVDGRSRLGVAREASSVGKIVKLRPLRPIKT